MHVCGVSKGFSLTWLGHRGGHGEHFFLKGHHSIVSLPLSLNLQLVPMFLYNQFHIYENSPLSQVELYSFQ